jgi:prepilin-type N-terminal cleavage/methylation domain-containing protein
MGKSADSRSMSRPRSRWAGGDGFTVIEVVIAMLILAVLGTAVLRIVEAATRNTFRAQQSQVVNDRLQEELERIKQLPYGQVALSQTPTHSSDQLNPNWRVSGTQFALNRNGTGLAPMVVNASGGMVNPGPSTFQSGNVSGKIYRYVVWQDDPACQDNPLCSGSQAIKHLVVAITLDSTAVGGARVYQELSTDLTNPDTSPVRQCTVNCGSGGSATPWTFWLTDTPCNNATRQPITADHATHNTLGRCANGLQTGSTAGAPDLMYTQAAPLDNSYPDNNQPLYDYASDVDPQRGTRQDKGLQEKVPDNVLNGGLGCLANPSGTTNPATATGLLPALGTAPQYYIHKWLSPQMPNGSDILLNGTATLDLWTQTVAGDAYPGKICIWLFTRQIVTDPTTQQTSAVDTAVVNLDQRNPDNNLFNLTYWTYSAPSWPSGGWHSISKSMHFAALHLTSGLRLGLAIAVERSGTLPGQGLQFQYDAPTFDSRLEADITSAPPF